MPQFSNSPKNKILIVLAALAIVQILLYAGLFQQMPFFDEGFYLAGGAAVAGGETPYVDFFAMKNPGVFFTLAFLFNAAGATLLTARIFMALIAVLQILLIFILARKMFNEKTAIIASAFYVIWSVFYPAFWATIEPFTTLISTAAVLFLYMYLFERQKTVHLFLFALFIGLSLLFKQTLIFFAVAAIIFFLAFRIFNRKKPGKMFSLKELVVFLAGLVIFPLLLALYLFANNIFPAFWEAVFIFPLKLIGWFAGVNIGVSLLAGLIPFAFVPALLLLIYFRRKPGEKLLNWKLLLIAFWFLAALTNILPYNGCCLHFIYFLPALSIISGFAIFLAFQKLPNIQEAKPAARRVIKAIRIYSVVIIFLSLAVSAGIYTYYTSPTYSFSDINQIADYVKSNTAETEKIFVIEATPELYFLSQREHASKYLYLFEVSNIPKVLEETTTVLEAQKPAMIIYFSRTAAAEIPFPSIRALIAENYVLEKTFNLQQPLYKFYRHAFIFVPRG